MDYAFSCIKIAQKTHYSSLEIVNFRLGNLMIYLPFYDLQALGWMLFLPM